MENYAGTFNPDLQLTDFDHSLLAAYGREIMLANHIHDRSALMPVAMQFGMTAQTDVACDEWMSSSPIYNVRNRRFLNITGDDVSVALKSLQVDIGAPHNFLNFHYDLVSGEEGYFWTSTCGPYLHVRAISNADEALETQICHHMEDPTFDATVMAVNPLMRCRPVYRPPYIDTPVPEKGPCKWQVAIQRDIGLVEDCPNLDKVQRSLAANFEFSQPVLNGDGLPDYSGAFQRDFCLEDLDHAKLALLCKEFMLHVLLLNYACYTAIAERFGEDKVEPIEREQWAHLAPITVYRLRRTFGIEGDDMGAILKVLQLNPFLPQEYFSVGFEQVSATEGYMWLTECAAWGEPVKRGIASLPLTHPQAPGFDALVHAVNAKGRVMLIEADALPECAAADDAVLAWKIVIDPAGEPVAQSEYANLVGADDLRRLDNRTHVYNYAYYDALESAG